MMQAPLLRILAPAERLRCHARAIADHQPVGRHEVLSALEELVEAVDDAHANFPTVASLLNRAAGVIR